MALDLGTAPPVRRRSSLHEFAGLGGLDVVRNCAFSFAAKILTPVDDILVPLFRESALPDLLSRSGIAGVITTPVLAARVPESIGLALAPDPIRVHHLIHVALAKMPDRLWEQFETEIHPDAVVHPQAYVAPRNVRIGPCAVVMPLAVVHECSSIGAGTRVHAHAVIGADAYEIVTIDGRQALRPQTGGVAIGRDCEILSGSNVARAAFAGLTTLGDHTVLDCNVTISHDVRIGSNVRIGGSSWIGGRARIEDRATLGPNCTVGSGVAVGEGATISLGSAVTRDVPAFGRVSGNFAIDHEKFIAFLRKIR